jgi:hypothetical protein
MAVQGAAASGLEGAAASGLEGGAASGLVRAVASACTGPQRFSGAVDGIPAGTGQTAGIRPRHSLMPPHATLLTQNRSPGIMS